MLNKRGKFLKSNIEDDMKRIKVVFSKLTVVGILLMMVAGFASCRDSMKDIYKGGDEDEDEKKEVPNDFDFSTGKSITISIHFDNPGGNRIPFKVYTQNPIAVDEYKNYVLNEALIAPVEGYTNEKGDFTLPIEVPASTTEIYVYSSYIGMPMLMRAEVNGTQVTVSSETSEVKDIRALRSRAAEKPYYTGWKEQTYSYTTYGNWNAEGKPDYVNSAKALKYKVDLTPDFYKLVNQFLPEKEVPSYSPYVYETMTLKEDAEVFLSFVWHEGGRNNALAYYIKNGASQEAINNGLIIAFPNLNGGVNSGDVVQLKYPLTDGTFVDEFPKGTTIGFVLLIDAYQSGKITNQGHVMYSEKLYNRYEITDNYGSHNMGDRPQMITGEVSGQIVLAFEDMPWVDSRTTFAPDFRNDIFVINANPVTAIPDDIKPVKPDEEDNPSYDFTSNFSGIYAFEDNWPKAGDYDMNDVVVSYIRRMRCKGDYMDNKLVMIEDEFQFLNNGASYKNAFGYELGGNLKKEQVKVLIESSYQCANQGIDGGLETATVMVFDDGRALGDSKPVFKVKTILNINLSYTDFMLGKGKMNPFIVVNGMVEDKRTEVHLPKYPPTKKMNMDLFGTEQDASDTDYYVSYKDNKYPFALDLVGVQYGVGEATNVPTFVIPAEKQAIDVAYPDFRAWVASGGQSETDWYKK